MKRPKLKDYQKENTKTISKHQLALTEWSWWAEDRIKELEKQLKLNGVVSTCCDLTDIELKKQDKT